MDKEFGKSLLNIPYYMGVNNNIQHEVGDFLRNNTTTPKLYSNDLRHQYTSALYARNKGNLAAKLLGGLNELGSFFEDDTREDSDIDSINNEIGRSYGLKYPDLSRNELLGKLLTDWAQNKELRNQKMYQKGYKKYGN